MQNPKERIERTICGCGECSSHCHRAPGYTLPGEIAQIAEYLGKENVEQFTEEYFVASKRTRVLIGQDQYIIPTLSPRMENGHCVFLNDAGECSIHAVSPYGCAYFDAHQPQAEAYRNSRAGLNYLVHCLENTEEGAEYINTWDKLNQQVA